MPKAHKPQHSQQDKPGEPMSALRKPKKALIPRKVWIISGSEERIAAAGEVLTAAGHEYRAAETSSELAPNLREFRPDLIVVDMQDTPDRGRHVSGQLRADRATRQLPIVLVGMASLEEIKQADSSVTGPTRRYTFPLNTPSVLNAILAELA